MKKSLGVMILAFMMATLLVSCGKSEAVIAVETMITEIELDNILLEEQDIEVAYDQYSALTEKEQNSVEGKDDLIAAKEQLDVLLNEISEVQVTVESIKEKDAPTQVEIEQLNAAYAILTDEQKERIIGFEDAVALRQCEQMVVYAINQYVPCLKNPSSFEVYEAKVKMDATGMLGNGVLFDYSSTNGFGGRIDNVACLDIGDKGKDSLFPLAHLLGEVEEYCLDKYVAYISADEEEIEIDIERIKPYIELR